MPLTVPFFYGTFGVFIFAALFVAGGILWSPFAALICALIASIRGLPIRRCALAGAVYSILLFLPWVYLVARMLGKSIPKQVVVAVYILLYGVVWLYGTAGFAVFAFLASSQSLIAAGAFVLSIFLCIASVSQFSRRRAYLRDNPDDLQDDILPNRAYIVPFAHTLGWMIVSLALGSMFI